MSWMEFVRTIWPIMASITPFILAGGFAWLKNQFPTKADLEKLRLAREQAVAEIRADLVRDIANLRVASTHNSDRQIAIEHRVKAVEDDLARAPSKIELSKDIGKVAERVGHLESSIQALSRQMETQNDYLHTLIERQIR